MQKVLVELGERSYPVYIGRETLATFGEVCRSSEVPNHVVVVTDSSVARLYLPYLYNALRHAGFRTETIVIPHGEQQKTLRRANAIITKLLHLGFGRLSALVALGGGVIGDLTGFVAATFRRGTTFIQCPTSLLAQIESSVGGKVGVNHPLAKNAIGVFYQPQFVFSDVDLLRTLPQREITCGLGEILKYGILNVEMFDFIESHIDAIRALDLDTIQEVELRCVSMKAKLVSEDEQEAQSDGGRAVLNLGHAIGQSLEALSHYRLHHGEAVLVGLRIESIIAKELGVLSEKKFQRIWKYYNRVDFQDRGFYPFSRERLIRLMRKARFVLPADVGEISFHDNVPEPVLRKSLAEFF